MYLNEDLSFDDYLSILKRKFFFIAALTSFISIVAFFVILFMPSIYESSSTILIEAEKVDVDEQNGRNKSNIATRFEALNAQLFTNEKMLEIAKKYDLYQSTDTKVLTPQDEALVANLVRSSINTSLIKAEVGAGWGQKPVLAVQITSQFGEPETTYNVTNDIVQAILNEESKRTKEKVISVSTFFDKEANEKKALLESIEEEIVAYKRSHANILPGNRQILIQSLERLRDDVNVAQKELGLARAELAGLRVELSSAKAGISTLAAPVQMQNSQNQDELDLLRGELSKALTIYSDNHPSVKSLRGKIAALEKFEVVEQKDHEAVKDIEVARVQVQIDAVNARIRSIESEKRQYRDRIKSVESMLLQTAQTEGVLDSLNRKYETAKVAYEKSKSKQDKARVEKEIELQDKGEKFVVIEPPVLPTYPVKPKRKLLLIGAILGSLILSAILSVVMEFLDRRLRGQYSIANAIKLQPMALVPYIKNQADSKIFRKKIYNLAYFNLVVLMVCIISIHYFVMPVEEFMAKLVDKV